jgi:hypothetical protein
MNEYISTLLLRNLLCQTINVRKLQQASDMEVLTIQDTMTRFMTISQVHAFCDSWLDYVEFFHSVLCFLSQLLAIKHT